MASDEYRRNAIECLQLADGISDTPSRLLLIHMAQAWLRLADQAEKNLTTDVVYETPVQRPASPRLPSGRPRKQDDVAAQTFQYEGYDIITLQKLIEREYSIPEPQTAEEVIGYYARRIAQDVKLPSQFSVLAPKVREFLERKAFGEHVSLQEPAMIKAISSNVAQYVTVKTFVEALRKIVLTELEPQLLHAGRSLFE